MCGALDLANTERELADVARKAAGQQQLGIPSEALNAAAVSALVPLLDVAGLQGGRSQWCCGSTAWRFASIRRSRAGPKESLSSRPAHGAAACCPGTLGPILRHGHSYVMQRSNSYTIAGSTTDRVGFDVHVDPAMVCRPHHRAHRHLPSLLLAPPTAPSDESIQ